MLVVTGSIVSFLDEGKTEYVVVIGSNKVRLYRRGYRARDVTDFIVKDPTRDLVAIQSDKMCDVFRLSDFQTNDPIRTEWKCKPVQQIQGIDDPEMFNPNQVVYAGDPVQPSSVQSGNPVQPPVVYTGNPVQPSNQEQWYGSPVQTGSRRQPQQQPTTPSNAVGIIQNSSGTDLIIPVTINGNQTALRLPNNPIQSLPRKRILPGSKVTFQLYSQNQLSQITGRIGMNGTVVYINSSSVPNEQYLLPANQQVYVYSV